MPTSPYLDILTRARGELSSDEQLRLIEELYRYIAQPAGQRKITELAGLGKEIWAGIDPDEFVRRERDSWGG